MLLELMTELDVTKEKVLMIGDTSHDLEMARNAGVPAIGVCSGAHPLHALEALEPLACLKTVCELRSWLQKNG